MDIKNILGIYLHFYPEEDEMLGLLNKQISNDEDLFSRKNFTGHITSSAFIINESSRQVLLLEHKSLKKLLQPGGHIDPDDKDPLSAALREVEEETGLKINELSIHDSVPNNSQVPFDIDTHEIPESKTKGEPNHYHHDFRYLFTTNNSDINYDPSESNSYKWIDWEDFQEFAIFKKVSRKINNVLASNTKFFFRSLVTKESKNISVVAVSHIIPSSEGYIKALKENFNLIGIIPKPKSINKNSLQRLESEGINILYEYTRENIVSHPDKLVNLLNTKQDVCLIDIGGYFSPIVKELELALGSHLIGIIEDTENGHQKYEKIHAKNVSVLSVARSPLKNYEDQLVGHGVAHATETVLR